MSAAPALDSANATPRTALLLTTPPAPASQSRRATGSSKTNSIPPVEASKTPDNLRIVEVQSDAWAAGAACPEKVPRRKSAGKRPQKTTAPGASQATDYPRANPSSSEYPRAQQNLPAASPEPRRTLVPPRRRGGHAGSRASSIHRPALLRAVAQLDQRQNAGKHPFDLVLRGLVAPQKFRQIKIPKATIGHARG